MALLSCLFHQHHDVHIPILVQIHNFDMFERLWSGYSVQDSVGLQFPHILIVLIIACPRKSFQKLNIFVSWVNYHRLRLPQEAFGHCLEKLA